VKNRKAVSAAPPPLNGKALGLLRRDAEVLADLLSEVVVYFGVPRHCGCPSCGSVHEDGMVAALSK